MWSSLGHNNKIHPPQFSDQRHCLDVLDTYLASVRNQVVDVSVMAFFLLSYHEGVTIRAICFQFRVPNILSSGLQQQSLPTTLLRPTSITLISWHLASVKNQVDDVCVWDGIFLSSYVTMKRLPRVIWCTHSEQMIAAIFTRPSR